MKIRKVTIRERDGTSRECWQVDLRYRGRGTRKRFASKGDADRFALRYGRLRKRGRAALGTPPTLEEFTQVLLEARRGTVAPSTYTILAQQLGHLCRYPTRPNVPIGTCRVDVFDGDSDLVLDIFKWHAGHGYAPSTVRLFRNALKELLDRAKSKGYLLEHPLHDPQMQRDLRNLFRTLREATPDEVRAFSAEQARHFLSIAERQSRLFPLLATGFGTGPRLGELVALSMADDQMNLVYGRPTRQLHIYKELTQRMSRRTPEPKQLKTGANYHVDVPADLGAILDDHKRTLDPEVRWLFQTGNGTPFSHEHVQGEFKRLLRTAKLEDPRYDFTPHSMRHTFATLHILAGKPAKWVSEQLGHADVIVTLKIYAASFKMACPGAADAHGVQLFGARVALDGNQMAAPTRSSLTEPAPVLH